MANGQGRQIRRHKKRSDDGKGLRRLIAGKRFRLPAGVSDIDEWFDEFSDKWYCDPDGVPEYPLHPCQWKLVHSVFISSMTLIEAVLDPDSVLIRSQAIDPNYANEFLKPVMVASVPQVTNPSHDIADEVIPARNIFRKKTDKLWQICFAGGGAEPEGGFVDEQIGFYHIQKLLSSEKQPVSYLDLYGAIPQKGIELLEEAEKQRGSELDEPHQSRTSRRRGINFRDKVDPETITLVRDRRDIVLTIIEQSKTNKDNDALEDAEQELVDLDKYLSSTIDLFGRSRQFEVGSAEAKARSRVKKNLSIALRSLKKFEKLSAFLKQCLPSQGADGREYMKAGEVKWETT